MIISTPAHRSILYLFTAATYCLTIPGISQRVSGLEHHAAKILPLPLLRARVTLNENWRGVQKMSSLNGLFQEWLVYVEPLFNTCSVRYHTYTVTLSPQHLLPPPSGFHQLKILLNHILLILDKTIPFINSHT